MWFDTSVYIGCKCTEVYKHLLSKAVSSVPLTKAATIASKRHINAGFTE